jgi:hypothetical protein
MDIIQTSGPKEIIDIIRSNITDKQILFVVSYRAYESKTDTINDGHIIRWKVYTMDVLSKLLINSKLYYYNTIKPSISLNNNNVSVFEKYDDSEYGVYDYIFYTQDQLILRQIYNQISKNDVNLL